ncbi:DUF4387 domain-containing protein [Gracilinema caldarium]|uniref:DUF4387 domain-containing protein n=1 Tax=Gracilinema caldarium TaxID=215591 RepID=UPI0026EF094A|nr:DUF4387 domain-containing protein [Gracilinema caldarium]
MKIRLIDEARVIRSKNSGPFELTLDIMFKEREIYEFFKSRNLINKALIATLYGVKEEEVLSVVYFEPAHAIKATLKRLIPSGAPGDRDIYGAQQHGPLLDLEWELT